MLEQVFSTSLQLLLSWVWTVLVLSLQSVCWFAFCLYTDLRALMPGTLVFLSVNLLNIWSPRHGFERLCGLLILGAFALLCLPYFFPPSHDSRFSFLPLIYLAIPPLSPEIAQKETLHPGSDLLFFLLWYFEVFLWFFIEKLLKQHTECLGGIKMGQVEWEVCSTSIL